MDNSLSKALIMVAGILLAVIVIGFMTFSFRRVGTWAEASDAERLAEQNAKFNKEYEVYDKDIMYGVDVISCLNKALSNNEAIRGLYAEAKDESYEVEVRFSIKSALTEKIKIYYMNDSGREVEYQGTNGPEEDVKPIDEIFEISNDYKNSGISRIALNRNLERGYKDTNVVAGTYILTADSSTTSTFITTLLKLSNELKQTVKNNSSTATNSKSWTKAEWETPLYDLKTRKFKCTNLKYSTQGRVNYIEFKEI